MNYDLRRSHGRIFAHWTCLYFSLCLWVVILCPAFVSQHQKKPLKTLKPCFCLKRRSFQPWSIQVDLRNGDSRPPRHNGSTEVCPRGWRASNTAAAWHCIVFRDNTDFANNLRGRIKRDLYSRRVALAWCIKKVMFVACRSVMSILKTLG